MRFSLLVATPAVALVLKSAKKQDPETAEPWACYRGDANTYRGTISTANTGQKCMQWSDAEADEDIGPAFAGDTFQEKGVKLEGNFCRAFQTDEKPWCYVLGAAAAEAKQVCDVPECPQDGVWADNYEKLAEGTVKCTDDTGAPAKDCDCSCDGVGGTALIQFNKAGEKRICHC